MKDLKWFEERLLSRIIIDEDSACWIWKGSMHAQGYGLFAFHDDEGKRYNILAHRMAMHVWRGFDLKSKAFILHDCDTPACVNPNHLSVGDAASNARARAERGRNGVQPASKKRRNAVREFWANMTPEERARHSSAISEGVRRAWSRRLSNSV